MMGNPDDDETVLFLFIAFAISIVLLRLLVLISCQTWMLWKMTCAVVEQDGSVRLSKVEKEDYKKFSMWH
jgi:hypothetical protein